jgi:tyrosine-protein kinase Etk/Wzc
MSAETSDREALARVEVSAQDLVGLIRRSESDPSREQVISVREVLDFTLRGRWLIAGTLLVVIAGVGLYTAGREPAYRASSYLLIHRDDNGLASILPTEARSLFGRERSLGNELFVLRRSESLADSVARRLIAHGRASGSGAALSILEPENGEAPSSALVARRLQETYVQAGLEGDDVDAIRISVTSAVPAEAALIANVYAAEFVALTREGSRSSFSASRRFLEEQVEEQAGALAAADAAVRNYMVSQGAVALDEESSGIVAQLAQLEAQRDAVAVDLRMKRATVAELQSELNGIEPRLARRIASGVDREIAAAQESILELQARLDRIYLRNPGMRTASEVPPEVTSYRQQLRDLEDRVARLSQQLLEESLAVGGGGPGDEGSGLQLAASLRRRLIDEQIALSGLEAQQAVLTARIAEYEQQLRAIPGQRTGLVQLERERQATERLFGAFQERLQEARVAEESELGYAQLVRSADVPDEPISPRWAMNLVLAAVLGLVTGVGLALVRYRLDDRVRRPDDLADLDTPLIGTVPDMTEMLREEFGGRETIEVDGMRLDAHLVTLLNPLTVASEAYRALRTSVQFSRPDAVIETVLVTSARPGEGKSTVVLNLAIAMAQAGRRTLVVDADLRKPTIHRKLGIGWEPGLVGLLFDGAPFDPSKYATPIDDLFVVPSGRTAPNPSELLGSQSLRDWIRSFRDHFDIVIFDAPPVLAATDAVLLSTQCDATIVVAAAGTTRTHEVTDTLNALTDVGARVIGTVLNRFDLSHAYGYKYRYSYKYDGHYAYGSDKQHAKPRRRLGTVLNSLFSV